MVFNSLKYVIFLAIVIAVYYIVPRKHQNIFLLVANYVFYAFWSVKYSFVLLFCTLITFEAALIIDKTRSQFSTEGQLHQKSEKRIFVITLVVLFSVLAIFKYTNFIIENVNIVLNTFKERNITPVSLVLPVGISFFTFQAAGYLIDIYKGKYNAGHSFINYAIFVSFFPQVLSGPIGRGDEQLSQYKNPREFNYDNFIFGALSFLWGLFIKMVISDRIAILVDTIYGDYTSYTGMQIIFATICFGLQIYTDFCGYSSMAIGSAKMLGILIPENFHTPYFSQSIKEFWRRWHISFSSWLKDYVYIPLGGSHCSKLKKYVNIVVTFLVSGIWHGAQWNYVIWGLLHGIYQIIGDLMKPVYLKINKITKINTKTTVWKICRMLITFCLVDFAWLFFRADGLINSFGIIKQIILELHPTTLFGGQIYELGLSSRNIKLVALSTAFLLLIDIFVYKGIDVKQWFREQNWVFKWIVVIFFVLLIILTGIWGNSYDAAGFIYFKF